MSTLLLRGLPTKTFIGLDLTSFDTSPQFTGIQDIPPGLHFLFAGTDASLSVRHGSWFEAVSGSIFTWQWDTEAERLKPQQAAASAASYPSPDSGLIQYAALRDAAANARSPPPSLQSNETTVEWHALISHISQSLLSTLLPANPQASTNQAGTQTHWSLTSITSSPLDAEPIPGLSSTEKVTAIQDFDPDSSPDLHLTSIDLSRTFPPTATGPSRTTHARDRSWYLTHLLDSLSSSTAAKDRASAANQLLGELQFCFVTTLLLANWSSLQGWRRILEVVLTCQTAIAEIPAFFAATLAALTVQVEAWEVVDGGLFETEIGEGGTGGSWFRTLLRRFGGSLKEAGDGDGQKGEAIAQVRERLMRLEGLLRDRYGWEDLGDDTVLRRGMVELEDGERVELSLEGADEEDEKGEYAPVFVDTGEDYEEEDGVKRAHDED